MQSAAITFETEAARNRDKVDAAPAGPQHLRLAEILGALSHALDMTEGQPAGHSVRCCWIATHLGEALGLPEHDATDLYYTVLLKDLGCSSNAARICELYLTDDLTFKHDFKRVGDSLPQVLRFVFAHTGLKAGLAERFHSMLNIVQNGGEIARELIETRCHRGAEIAAQMHFSEAVADGIRDLDEHWDGTGKPAGLAGPAISPLSGIALMAQVVDVFHTSSGVEATKREIRGRAGTWFAPALCAAFETVATAPGFWERLGAPDLEAAVFALEPGQRVRALDDDYLDDIAAAFAKVVDAKSPFTHGHSQRVSLFADMIAMELGFAPDRRRRLTRAGLLHDIGKLGVSNQILDKPGKLDDTEWVSMRGHAAAGETILSRIEAFGELALIAGSHHERLDGKGYPRGLGGSDLGLETRIMTVADIFDALTADRPYRAAMPREKALGIMAGDVGSAVDADCLEGLRAALVRMDLAKA